MKNTYILNGKSLAIDESKCTGCGICAEVCPHSVLSITKGKATILERHRCMECGACAMNCPFAAIAVDKGVGCAAAIIGGLLRGTAPECGCDCGIDSGKKKRSACC